MHFCISVPPAVASNSSHVPDCLYPQSSGASPHSLCHSSLFHVSDLYPCFFYASLVFTHCLVLWISGWFMDSVVFPAPYLHFCAWPTSALFRNTWILDLAPCLIPACETALALFNSAPPTCACGDLSGFMSWMTANLVEPFLWKKII